MYLARVRLSFCNSKWCPQDNLCKPHLKLVAALWIALMVPAALAESRVEILIERKVCLGCHQINTARVGPPFSAIAQRYRERPEAQIYLENAIRQGGQGRWGRLSMPAQPQVSPEEARDMARWILLLPISQKKS